MKINYTKKSFTVPAALFCCFLWGSAFPFIKVGYKLMNISKVPSEILYAGMRFTLAGILVLIFGSLMQKKFLLPKKAEIPKVCALSLFQTVLQYLFFYIGLGNTTGVKASVIEASGTFVAIAVSALIFHQEHVTAQKWLGCLIGFIGVVIINAGSGFDFSFKFTGEGFVFISTVSYAFSSVLIKEFSKTSDPVTLSGWQFLIGGIVMIIIGLCAGGNIAVSAWSVKAVILLLYLAFISAAAYSIWGILLKYNPVSEIAVLGFTNPVFGVILSGLVIGEAAEAFSLKSLISLVLVAIGIITVNKKIKKVN